jgi:HAD superfamily hydrolase (TIGR01459 family)
MISELNGLSAVIDRYDAIISDVWGVLHNGLVATPGAQEALEQARAAGKAVILLTNAPRPPGSIRAQLRDLAVRDTAYDALISSGGVARPLLQKEGAARFFHIGPERDSALFAGLECTPSTLETANLLLCTGLFDDEVETPESYRPLLEQALPRRLRLLCANPDLIVERGSRLIPCAGAIAELYEEMGGEVVWIGKPRPMVYEIAKDAAEQALGRKIDPARILCIGDAIRTDIAGAGNGPYDSLFILAGIHGHQIGLRGERYDAAKLVDLIAKNANRPTHCMVSLRW